MLLSGTAPFQGANTAAVLKAVKKAEIVFEEYCFQRVSANAKDFITTCMTKNPELRPTAQEALSHKWFKLLHRPQRGGGLRGSGGGGMEGILRRSFNGIAPFVHAELLQLNENTNLPDLDVVKKLADHTSRSVLCKIFRDVVAHTLQPEQISRLREQFTKFDLSECGEITVPDLQSILSQFNGFPEGFINVLISGLNIDQNGKISYHEFLAATISNKEITDKNVQMAFERISGHTTVITSKQIHQLLGDANYDVEVILKEIGLNVDAELNFEDVSSKFLLCLLPLCIVCVWFFFILFFYCFLYWK